MPFKNKHPLYHVWNSMRGRCQNPAYKQWKDYGGRGIRVCERWDSFHLWLADMGPRPPGYVIDRINNDGDYEPGNCRWTTRRENQLNRRNTVHLVIEGESYRAADLAALAGRKTDTVVARASRGLPMADVLSPGKRHDISGFKLGGRASGDKRLAQTHCKNGHPWNEENTRYGKKQRECRACAREKMTRRREARRAH